MGFVPYTARHGGASHDAATGFRSQEGIKRRGRWLVDGSVRRYEKHALLNKQLARLSKQQLRAFEQKVNDLPRAFRGD